MTNTQYDVVFVTDTDYKVVFASVQSWQVIAVMLVGGCGGLGGGCEWWWCDGRCSKNLPAV